MRRLLIATMLAGVLASAAGAQGSELTGNVGPDFSIDLLLPNGSPVTRLEPGTYRLVINDRADDHNFHLVGGGIDMTTDVGGKDTTTWTLTLKEANYVFFCDPHFSSMKGEFVVGNPPASAPQPKPGPDVPTTPITPTAAKKLGGSVGPGATITLAFGGAKVKTLKPGAYAITVRDRSAKDNFHLVGPGVNKKTAIATTSTTTWNVTLKSGTYTYRSDANAKLKGSFTVRG